MNERWRQLLHDAIDNASMAEVDQFGVDWLRELVGAGKVRCLNLTDGTLTSVTSIRPAAGGKGLDLIAKRPERSQGLPGDMEAHWDA